MTNLSYIKLTNDCNFFNKTFDRKNKTLTLKWDLEKNFEKESINGIGLHNFFLSPIGLDEDVIKGGDPDRESGLTNYTGERALCRITCNLLSYNVGNPNREIAMVKWTPFNHCIVLENNTGTVFTNTTVFT